MSIYFSPKTTGFYPVKFLAAYQSAGTWPDDAYELTDEELRSYYITHPPAGKMLGSADGKIAWVDIPPPTPAELQQQAESQKQSRMSQAANSIAPLQYAVDLKMATNAELTLLTAWKKYCVLLNRVDCSTAPEIDWPKAPE
ncbi:tail fiber assembly protein [Xenorhabdus kozodoii]|nr:tail fiber assembly protein [Xenorhabdus kozodoii]